MFKKIIYALVIFISTMAICLAYNYETNIPLPGKTITSQELQKESLFTIYAFAQRIAKQDCMNFAIIDTEVSEPKIDNKWQEIWTIKACSRTARVPIDFEVKPKYNIYAIDPMGVKVIENLSN